MNKQLALLFFLFFTSYFQLAAQTLDYKYQVAFVYNIAKNTQWQPEHSTGDFIIGVLGNNSIATTFEQNLHGKKIASQNIKIASFTSLSDIQYCHILFVPASSKVDLTQVLSTLGDKNILICTERDGWGKKGSMVNFITVDGKIKFEINADSLKKSSLRLSNSITSLGIMI